MAENRIIFLPKPSLQGQMSLEEAIAKRRSERSFTDKDLSLEQVGQLLWAAQGITSHRKGRGLRAAPSAGALYPLEVYALTQDGVFHYLPEKHALELLDEKDLRQGLARAAWDQDSITQAPLNLVVCAVYARVTQKYGERGRLYAHKEVGHAAQNVHLQAVSLGLGSVPMGAFEDVKVKELLHLPSEQEPLYIIPIGYTR